MFKLSRKGWNNVIIVAVLIVITLLHRMETAQQENSAKRARPLLPDAAVVLTWQGPSWQIERIGQGWRSVPDLGLDTAQLDARLARWQGWLLPPARRCAAPRWPSRCGLPARAIRSRSASIRTAANMAPSCRPVSGSPLQPSSIAICCVQPPEFLFLARCPCLNCQKLKSAVRGSPLAHRHQGDARGGAGWPPALANPR